MDAKSKMYLALIVVAATVFSVLSQPDTTVQFPRPWLTQKKVSILEISGNVSKLTTSIETNFILIKLTFQANGTSENVTLVTVSGGYSLKRGPALHPYADAQIESSVVRVLMPYTEQICGKYCVDVKYAWSTDASLGSEQDDEPPGLLTVSHCINIDYSVDKSMLSMDHVFVVNSYAADQVNITWRTPPSSTVQQLSVTRQSVIGPEKLLYRMTGADTEPFQTEPVRYQSPSCRNRNHTLILFVPRAINLVPCLPDCEYNCVVWYPECEGHDELCKCGAPPDTSSEPDQAAIGPDCPETTQTETTEPPVTTTMPHSERTKPQKRQTEPGQYQTPNIETTTPETAYSHGENGVQPQTEVPTQVPGSDKPRSADVQSTSPDFCSGECLVFRALVITLTCVCALLVGLVVLVIVLRYRKEVPSSCGPSRRSYHMCASWTPDAERGDNSSQNAIVLSRE